jgi:hypothetical protein
MSDAGSDNSDRIQSDEEHKEEYDEYDEEMERNRRFAKYWCGEEKEVIIGVVCDPHLHSVNSCHVLI